MEQRPLTLPEALVPLAEWLAVNLPGYHAVKLICIVLPSGERASIPLPLPASPTPRSEQVRERS